jgi:NTP pyrophosphatase (non-canonical NTP hydrolase)
MMDLKTLGKALREITNERRRQDAKWGEQNHDDYRWLAILIEEVGELAQCALHDEFGGHAAGKLRGELVQVAAVAVSWLECLDRRGR